MRVSELVKKLFKVMGKHGDVEVVGDFEVLNMQVVLRSPEVGLDKEESEVLPKLLTDQKGNSTSIYL
jgi:hypothetical protein